MNQKPVNQKPVLALFDLDGTITTKDSMVEFLFFCKGKWATYKYFLLRILDVALYKLKKLEGQVFKESVFHDYLGGMTKDEIWKMGNTFATQELPKLVRPYMLERIHWHKNQGHKVYIISASIDIWIQAWANQLDVQLISTQLAFNNNRFIGKFATPNCNGAEKVNRLKQTIDPAKFEIYGYGNSSGDKPFLALCQHVYYKPEPEDFLK